MRRQQLSKKNRNRSKTKRPKRDVCPETGKVKHATEDAAIASIHFRHRGAMRAYRCDKCGQIHLTTKPFKPRSQKKRLRSSTSEG